MNLSFFSRSARRHFDAAAPLFKVALLADYLEAVRKYAKDNPDDKLNSTRTWANEKFSCDVLREVFPAYVRDTWPADVEAARAKMTARCDREIRELEGEIEKFDRSHQRDVADEQGPLRHFAGRPDKLAKIHARMEEAEAKHKERCEAVRWRIDRVKAGDMAVIGMFIGAEGHDAHEIERVVAKAESMLGVTRQEFVKVPAGDAPSGSSDTSRQSQSDIQRDIDEARQERNRSARPWLIPATKTKTKTAAPVTTFELQRNGWWHSTGGVPAGVEKIRLRPQQADGATKAKIWLVDEGLAAFPCNGVDVTLIGTGKVRNAPLTADERVRVLNTQVAP